MGGIPAMFAVPGGRYAILQGKYTPRAEERIENTLTTVGPATLTECQVSWVPMFVLCYGAVLQPPQENRAGANDSIADSAGHFNFSAGVSISPLARTSWWNGSGAHQLEFLFISSPSIYWTVTGAELRSLTSSQMHGGRRSTPFVTIIESSYLYRLVPSVSIFAIPSFQLFSSIKPPVTLPNP
ncbi:hypothetical protein C8R44DRAFT_738996 [Mycena epipterygia]|nr:hypothetical protein C8R44DRAFT_738996 [Mycena epipterygia]